MNERIRELAKQAVQLVANEHTKGDVSRLNTDSYHVKDLINTKFAELIIEEYIDNGPYDGRNLIQCGMAIKKHFGGEE
jgi:predicted transcriptional regulator of viral defense system